MEALQRSSLPDQVFRALVSDVVEGRYAPGDRLPPQRTLAAELGVNMASLREGVKRLEQLRLVDVRHGDAMRVRDWRADGGLDVLAHVALSQPELQPSLFEARRLLLEEAARLAARRRSDEQAQALRELAAAFAAAPDDDHAQALDLAFMGTVIEAAGNLVFTLIVNSMRDLYLQHRERFRALVSGRDELAPLYEQAARAVADADADRAAAAIAELAARQEERLR